MALIRTHYWKRINCFAGLRLAPLLAVVFLYGQVLASTHAAGYVDAEHKHFGESCIIAAAHKQDDKTDVEDPAATVEPKPCYRPILAGCNHHAYSTVAAIHAIRGPPNFS